jgi:ribulose kinase
VRPPSDDATIEETAVDTTQLVSEFLASDHGAQALQALGAQGVSDADARDLLSHATGAAVDHVESQNTGIMGDHPGKSFFAAFAAGLVHGDGFFKSLVDGGEGVMAGRVAEALGARVGLDPATASSIAAAATPYIVGFLKQRLS